MRPDRKTPFPALGRRFYQVSTLPPKCTDDQDYRHVGCCSVGELRVRAICSSLCSLQNVGALIYYAREFVDGCAVRGVWGLLGSHGLAMVREHAKTVAVDPRLGRIR